MTDVQQKIAAQQFAKNRTGHGDEKQKTQRFWIDLPQNVFGVVNSIKITFPRKNISGSLNDTAIYGCQQHVPLANIER